MARLAFGGYGWHGVGVVCACVRPVWLPVGVAVGLRARCLGAVIGGEAWRRVARSDALGSVGRGESAREGAKGERADGRRREAPPTPIVRTRVLGARYLPLPIAKNSLGK